VGYLYWCHVYLYLINELLIYITLKHNLLVLKVFTIYIYELYYLYVVCFLTIYFIITKNLKDAPEALKEIFCEHVYVPHQS
jgi:hypothetical protein